MRHHAFPDGYTREDLLDWYRRNRERTRELFDLVVPEAYYDRPIALRNPIVFYEGHLPAFSVNTLIKLTLGRRGVDDRLEVLFARGIDPESEDAAKSPTDVWPSRDDVRAYAEAADAVVLDALSSVPIGEAVFTILEHEQMHHETLLYMFHNLSYEKKRGAAGSQADVSTRRQADSPRLHKIPRGTTLVGTEPGTFGWDNEFPSHTVPVEPFAITPLITNAEYREFTHATEARPPHFWSGGDQWRGMFALQPMRWDAPVWVTHDEATAYARWRGMRLPTEAEWHRANEEVDLEVGQGWEWTSSRFAPYEGFRPMQSYPQYSVDFFDDAHFVLKGASPATARELIRPGFRNWFRPNYPYLYATFRCARDVH